MLLRQLHAPEEANDLLQQTFLHVHRARLDFDRAQRFRPWVFTIALNLKREHFRRVRRRPALSLDSESVPEPAVLPRGALRWEAARDVGPALERLAPEQREVIELHWFGGLSFAEIGECVGATTNAVKVRAHRGYVVLRRLLGSQAPDQGNQAGGSGI
jgi:RNA polymerase sigma-70 factor (ECF subfamily)